MQETPDLSTAAMDHLRVIRQLMERSTAYRAISALPALVAGVLGLGLGVVFLVLPEPAEPRVFVLSWLGALLAADGFNTWVLWREARKRGAAFPSPAAIHGLKMLAPPMLACGLAGLALAWWQEELARGALLWVVGYGLGLLATGSFAPRSIRALGWAFVAAGTGWFFWREMQGGPGDLAGDSREAATVMAATFGAFHLVYALREGFWKRGEPA